MNQPTAQFGPAPGLADFGYDDTEAPMVAQAAILNGLPLHQFAIDLMASSIHETGHQMTAIWQGATDVKAHLSLIWPERDEGRMVAGRVAFSGLNDSISRRAVAVAGAVAELLMPDPNVCSSEDDWDLYAKLRDGNGMSAADLAMTDGKITWHAVKRAAKLMRRHWSIIRLSSASKRKTLLYQLTDQLPYVPRRQTRRTSLQAAEERPLHA